MTERAGEYGKSQRLSVCAHTKMCRQHVQICLFFFLSTCLEKDKKKKEKESGARMQDLKTRFKAFIFFIVFRHMTIQSALEYKNRSRTLRAY